MSNELIVCSEDVFKECSKCGDIKSIREFCKSKQQSTGVLSSCKYCKTSYDKANYTKNPKKFKDKCINWRLNNPEKYNQQNKELYQKHKEASIKRCKEWVKLHPHYKVDRHHINKHDPLYKLIFTARGRILQAIKRGGYIKSKNTRDLLGCDNVKIWKKHLEKQFKVGMSWDNHSLYGWHIDHIIPITAFDLSDPEEQLKAFNYKNTQPLWCWENWSKGSSIVV